MSVNHQLFVSETPAAPRRFVVEASGDRWALRDRESGVLFLARSADGGPAYKTRAAAQAAADDLEATIAARRARRQSRGE